MERETQGVSRSVRSPCHPRRTRLARSCRTIMSLRQRGWCSSRGKLAEVVCNMTPQKSGGRSDGRGRKGHRRDCYISQLSWALPRSLAVVLADLSHSLGAANGISVIASWFRPRLCSEQICIYWFFVSGKRRNGVITDPALLTDRRRVERIGFRSAR